MPGTATKTQRGRYWALVGELRKLAPFPDDARRAVTERICGGASSTKDLDGRAMAALIREIEGLIRASGGKVSTRRTKGEPNTRHSRRQFGKIMALANVLAWPPNRLGGFIRRQTGGWKSDVSTLTRHEASMVISGLDAEIKSIETSKARGERSSRQPAPPRFRTVMGGLTP